MATVPSTNLTYADWAKRVDPNGKVDTIIELMSKTNPILEDAAVVEGNLQDGHKTTVRTSQPTGTFRMLNQGVAPEKSDTKQVIDRCGMLEAYAQVDKALADLNGDQARFRLSEEQAFISGLGQTMAEKVFYGNQGLVPQEFTGLAPRFNDLDGEYGGQIIDAGGEESDNTSIWLVCWGDNTAHFTFPKGSKAGLQHDNLGEQTHTFTDGSMMQVYRSHYRWDMGLVVRDFRQVVRIANIDVSDLTGSGAVSLLDKMAEAEELLFSASAGRPVFYMNRTVRTALRKQMIAKNNVNLTYDSAGGKMVMKFGEIPVRACDAILSSEARVV